MSPNCEPQNMLQDELLPLSVRYSLDNTKQHSPMLNLALNYHHNSTVSKWMIEQTISGPFHILSHVRPSKELGDDRIGERYAFKMSSSSVQSRLWSGPSGGTDSQVGDAKVMKSKINEDDKLRRQPATSTKSATMNGKSSRKSRSMTIRYEPAWNLGGKRDEDFAFMEGYLMRSINNVTARKIQFVLKDCESLRSCIALRLRQIAILTAYRKLYGIKTWGQTREDLPYISLPVKHYLAVN